MYINEHKEKYNICFKSIEHIKSNDLKLSEQEFERRYRLSKKHQIFDKSHLQRH